MNFSSRVFSFSVEIFIFCGKNASSLWTETVVRCFHIYAMNHLWFTYLVMCNAGQSNAAYILVKSSNRSCVFISFLKRFKHNIDFIFIPE